jgi:hypothetical protein
VRGQDHAATAGRSSPLLAPELAPIARRSCPERVGTPSRREIGNVSDVDVSGSSRIISCWALPMSRKCRRCCTCSVAAPAIPAATNSILHRRARACWLLWGPTAQIGAINHACMLATSNPCAGRPMLPNRNQSCPPLKWHSRRQDASQPTKCKRSGCLSDSAAIWRRLRFDRAEMMGAPAASQRRNLVAN